MAEQSSVFNLLQNERPLMSIDMNSLNCCESGWCVSSQDRSGATVPPAGREVQSLWSGVAVECNHCAYVPVSYCPQCASPHTGGGLRGAAEYHSRPRSCKTLTLLFKCFIYTNCFRPWLIYAFIHLLNNDVRDEKLNSYYEIGCCRWLRPFASLLFNGKMAFNTSRGR